MRYSSRSSLRGDRFIDGFFVSTEDPEAPLPAGVTWPEGRDIWTADGKSGQVAEPDQLEQISGRIRFGADGAYVETLDPVSPVECSDQPS